MTVAINRSYCVGICSHPDHPTPIPMDGYVLCSRPLFTVDGNPIAIKDDTVYGRCGHTGKLMSNLSSMTYKGKGVAKLGSVFTGDFSGTVISGDSKMNIP